MGNEYYDSGSTRAAKVRLLFATIAPRYDLINDLQSFGLHRWWKRKVVRLTGVKRGERALDVCCGTGDIAMALACRGARVIGLDFSAPMLEVARNRSARARGLETDLQFEQGDAQCLPFPAEQFDVVTVGYGLRNLASWEMGLREMARVARPGGRIVVLDFGKPENRLWRALYFGYLRLCVPLLGRLFAGDAAAYAYIIESLHHYPAQRGVQAAMRRMSLESVGVVNILGGVMSINHATKPAKQGARAQ